jgi:hypothetical protein
MWATIGTWGTLTAPFSIDINCGLWDIAFGSKNAHTAHFPRLGLTEIRVYGKTRDTMSLFVSFKVAAP